MRRALVAIFFVACGGPTAAKRAPPMHARDAGTDAARDAATDAGPSALVLLERSRDDVAPGAREAASAELDLSRDHELGMQPFDVDTCLRAAFRAGAPTSITLLDARERTVATADGSEGMIGASGPICFRKGDAVTFRFEGASRLAIVVWATP
ncbi:MAG TPA: hypothetical protein VGH28_23825 [Polyangiaceae bacterium]